MNRIYLDTAATTRVDPEVMKAMEPYFTRDFGNMASLHSAGRDAENAVEKARRLISGKVNGKEHRLVFTSGGTESNNFALKGIAFANMGKGKHIITTRIEHDCVLNSARWLEKQGFEVTYLPVDRQGFVSTDDFADAIRKDTILASVIHANNEIGTIEPIRELGKIAHEKGVLFHTDACQSFTKVPIDLKKDNIDLMTVNSHKIYGPKGVGGLFIRQGMRIDPLLHGGGQEFGYRSGTVNVSGIIGFSKAADMMKENHVEHMAKLRDMLIEGALEIKDSWLNGPSGNLRLANNAHITFKHIEGESLIIHLDLKGIASSTGSACSSKTLEPSHVLTSLGLRPEEAHGSVRFSVGRDNTKEEIEYTIGALRESVETLRKISPLR
ncbi:MAG: cysteine desulfurase [Candidatus Aenigmarchaeota archaeon]|nr:cysteine desulfurase [Candidatus Aenigmarchaeota archaeon]